MFIEELDKFQSIQDVSMFLTCIGQSRLMEQVTGLLFGHYSDNISPLLFDYLQTAAEIIKGTALSRKDTLLSFIRN